ncbi:hypothetical protein EN828_04550 [Mesorhizobium sp. M2D.F.Ca.ET.185.01.1.1]|uniref:DUF6894 family protein n=1 Tax=unclassified Mesorhizobium TaxID=325217 RepID=UPI000FCC2AA0|nr:MULTISPECIES: hypothetical protein [unclassified Mesorhizobium]TGP77275.1 hypothetical protein EN870_18585 [bacterium M00.F.Ca.ET.227.01.1.1]TGP93068.1 hypothetical protein EN865_18780 [bacterium M00.F.Ca.ET.222.01.1.1]TGP96614.1 hypothetical protein EN864_09065 [bacterium M00.F.Ca.ET.221.01.1.1]TGU20756.1 hypothetical protein EN799_55370 [bacterium M00.F.Ca.ET.156.01.1.1]TGU49826.1 hypothetical protein EN789_04475 [bacterium M00.F.Ca.ET.146.01.1.1]TGV68691.1 hypothetical protein EN803_166
MARFFFDISYGGDVYHDAHGSSLKGQREAMEGAFDIVRKLMAEVKPTDLVCTVRDAGGHQIMQIKASDADRG